MKKVIAGIVLIVAIMMVFSQQVNACEISFKIASEEKQTYKVGEEIVVTLEVVLTHRNCSEGIDATKYDFTGVKVLGATKWKEISGGKFERKFKLQVTDDEKGKHLMSATRTCDRDGGAGSIKFDVN